jgi:membrane-bound lytic murein transglycosylase MltF
MTRVAAPPGDTELTESTIMSTSRNSILRALPVVLVLLAFAIAIPGCGGGSKAPAEGSTSASKPAADAEAPLPPVESALPEGLRGIMAEPFTGDFDAMVKRRIIRLGVTFNRTFYFVDKGAPRGAAYEYGKLFEDDLNKKLDTGNMKVHVIFVPLPRDLLASALVGGRIDAAIAQITITPDKQQLVDFTIPTRTNVSEVVVTGPGAPGIASVADLSGKDVFVRRGGTYHQSLLALNEQLKAQGKPSVNVQFVPANLEDDDVLEMVNAGLMPITVVDDYLAAFWKKIFTSLTVHDTVTVRRGGDLAVAFRKNSPQLAATLNAFIKKNGLGTAFGNMMQTRYLDNTKLVKNAASEADRKKLQSLIAIFQKYGDQYDMDYLLMGAQAYQESGLDQGAKSQVGAIGIMQLMPQTGKEQNVGDIHDVDANIHAGVKYMRFMMDQYFKDEPMDRLNKGLFAFASYNAGPGRIRQLRKEAEKQGLDPNLWFGNVEQVASERIGRETVTYVSNIYKYYVAYQLVVQQNAAKAAAKKAVAGK